MSSSHLPKGRGRGRHLTRGPSSSPNVDAPPAISRTIDVTLISTVDDTQTLVTTSMTTGISDSGNGCHTPQPEIEVPDPVWTVSDLTNDQFKSKVRPIKPLELGTVGQPIKVKANYFPITEFPQEGIVYQYDIEIRNRKDQLVRRDHRRTVYYSWLRSFRDKYPDIDPYKIVFDNLKIIFTFEQPLPNIDGRGLTEKITGPNRYGRQEDYEVSIKQVGNPIDLHFLRAIKDFSQTQNDDKNKLNDLQSFKQMLSIVLHEHCSSHADFIFNRSFFSQSLATDRFDSWDLGLGKVIWRGFYSSLVFSKGTYQLLMNLDVRHRVFLKEQSFLDFLYEVMRQSPCGRWRYGRQQNRKKVELKDILDFLDRNISLNYYEDEIDFLLKNCKNCFVRSEVLDRKTGYRIDGLGDAAATQTFHWEQKNAEITVENYYKEQYGIELKYPTLPTLRMHNGSFVPMEFIHIEPAKVTETTEEQRAAFCSTSSLKPSIYYKSINEVRQNPTQQCFEDDRFSAAWNINIQKNMLTVPARILPPPKIISNKNSVVTYTQGDRPGVWNHTRTQFYQPAAFPPVWALINLSSSLNDEECEIFDDKLRNVANERGIACPVPVLYEKYDASRCSSKEIIGDLSAMMEKNIDCGFVLVILPENKVIRDQIYGDLKALYELESGFGTVTQMIRLRGDEHQGRWSYSRVNNILMKINTKLNGINSVIDVHKDIKKFFSGDVRTMYVGIDLSHGPLSSSRRYSTVAAVASVGDMPVRYLKEIYIQERPSDARGESWEYVVDMKEIMKSLIQQYKEHQRYPPDAIIIYRDGISTSEFDTVFEKELTAIREACVELSPAYRPYLTYIVVNKKHHTRFFPTDSNGNIVAGTIVDSPDVTNPTTNDFYLSSHHVDGEKGTSRPTHYHVLYDDNKLTPDQVQQLTYALCYLYARCSSSISIPVPVKYAHLLAFRAAIYKNRLNESNEEPLITESVTPDNQEANVANTIKSRRIVLSEKLKADCVFFL